MKQVLLTIATVFLLLISGCEKEQTLSEFLLGEWESQEVQMSETVLITFLVTIEKDHYTLSMTDGSQTVTLGPLSYTVNDELNEITIEEPVFDDGDKKSGDPIMITFMVSWTENGNTMTWTPKSEQTGAPIIVWTRSTDR